VHFGNFHGVFLVRGMHTFCRYLYLYAKSVQAKFRVLLFFFLPKCCGYLHGHWRHTKGSPNRTRICFCYLPHIKTKIKRSAFHNQELLDATLSSCQSATLPLRRPTQAPPKIFCNHTAASFGETWKHQNQTRGRAMLSSIKCTSRVTAGSAKH
jgi:hypothetical protein